MTAFAAIVQKRGARLAVEEVAEALGSLGGADPAVVSIGPCALLLAPLHHDDPDGPVVLPAGIAVAGQILLEGRRDLASTLRQPSSACSAALAGAAYARWGERCTEHLSGEYAFALWDSNAQTLLCARDGMGLRLLYVADSPDTLIVTNVLSAALRHRAIPDDPDDGALVEFLAHGGAADEVRTPYRHVRVLPAGHTLAVDAGRGSTRMHRHWRFPVPDPAPRRGQAAVLEQYRSALTEAVRDRMSGSTSIFLSGGVDSTTIAAAARDVAPSGRLQAITARYPRYVADGELRYARAAASASVCRRPSSTPTGTARGTRAARAPPRRSLSTSRCWRTGETPSRARPDTARWRCTAKTATPCSVHRDGAPCAIPAPLDRSRWRPPDMPFLRTGGRISGCDGASGWASAGPGDPPRRPG